MYYHARNDHKTPAQTGYIVLLAKSVNAVEHYKGQDGVIYEVSELPADTLDITQATNQQMIIDAFVNDYNNGILSYDADQLFETINGDWESFKSELNPTNIVDTAGAWDAPEFVEWFWNHFEISAIKTNDGAAIIDPTAVNFKIYA